MKPRSTSRKIHQITGKIFTPLRDFLKDSRAVGIVLIVCTIVSLSLANSALHGSYLRFWESAVHLPFPGLHLPHSLLHWINDGLMVIFFFLVGMEIKRELFTGELSSLRKSLLPILAALGGMLCPALIFLSFNGATSFSHGWGIPMATDIAFSLGILSLLGDRVPVSLKIFLTALAIIDDLGAIIAIAIFYTGQVHLVYLFTGLGIWGLLVILNLCGVKRLLFYFIPGVLLWYCIFNSGIHATIAGVLLAVCIPLSKIQVLEHRLHGPVNFIIMPVFALANTAILLPPGLLHAFETPMSAGIICGLVLGKPLGILLFSWVSVRLKIAVLPAHVSWKQIIGVGAVAGIGFTMSIFIATLAFKEPEWQAISKLSVIVASAAAGITGYVWLRLLKSKISG